MSKPIYHTIHVLRSARGARALATKVSYLYTDDTRVVDLAKLIRRVGYPRNIEFGRSITNVDERLLAQAREEQRVLEGSSPCKAIKGKSNC